MLTYKFSLRCSFRLCLAIGLLLGWTALARAMPTQVIIIRHAEKYEDPKQIHLSPKGRTRALALAELFQSDPRVLEFGRPAAIIAQGPTGKKPSRRCLETVEPLAAALHLPVVAQFTYGQSDQLVQWLKEQRQLDGKAVLICMQHMEVDELAQALGIADLRPRIWPHETYDRLYILTYAQDGKLLSWRNLPQCLLFGDSFQAVTGPATRDKAEVRFSQIYRAGPAKPAAGKKGPAPRWQFSLDATIKGDFSHFNDDTIPVLRVGGFCFGYYLTTLGRLQKDPQAVVKIKAPARSGSLVYRYQAKAGGGAARPYAWVSFAWDKHSLRVKFRAEVNEGSITPEIDLPIPLEPGRPVGLIAGNTPCCVAFGAKKFQAPAGVAYQGLGGKPLPPAPPGAYQAILKSDAGLLVEKIAGPEIPEQVSGPGEPNAK